jgi:hypothetical protein
MTVKRQAAKGSPFRAANLVGGAGFVIGAEASNIINVGIQLRDANGADLQEMASVEAYLSDNADGSSVVATAPTTVAIGTDGVSIPLVTGKRFTLVSEADGDIDLNITLSSGAATYYLILVMPDGSLVKSAAITFAA